MPDSPAVPVTGPSNAEKRAQTMIRRQKRNMRKASAEGFLNGVAAMLRPGDLVLDCGANVGNVTAILASTGADVIAYEPDPACFSLLQERFSGSPNVALINAALGVNAGKVRLMRASNFDDNPESASVKSTIISGGRAIDEGNGIDVDLLSLPDLVAGLVAERGPIAFVKMDIEGAELEILEMLDAKGQLNDIRCLVAETHERKFKDLRPRYHALRRQLSDRYGSRHINLDWI